MLLEILLARLQALRLAEHQRTMRFRHMSSSTTKLLSR